MTGRQKYSIDEIARMREAVTTLTGSDGAEERLRTYMLNGTEPAELEQAAAQHMDPIMRRQKDLAKLSDEWTRQQQYRGGVSGF